MESILTPTTFERNYINHLHIELTNRCNAACPMCMRFHQSSPLLRPDLELGEISLEQFTSWFSPEFFKKIILVLFCGVHGDPCIAKDTLEITEYIVNSNPNTNILFNTNGGMRNPEWWSKLGSLLKNNKDNWVTFSIDGLEDTNHLYRRNVKWDKVMANAKAFIAAGGRAHWDFLIFKHNEHQIDEARQLATEMGFSRFIPKKALGVDNGVDLHPMGALTKEGTLDYIIEAPLDPKNRNLESYGKIGSVSANFFTPEQYKKQKEEKSIQQYHKWSYTKIYDVIDDNLYEKENKCQIKCKSLRPGIVDIFIDNYGNVLPCCYVGTHLNGNYADDKTLQLHHEIKKYGLEKFNLNHNSFENIIKEQHIDNVFTKSWIKDSVKTGKMLFCADTCGQNSSIDRIYTHEGTVQLK
jgi:MoaA/NifB/PqqE/SkfB family radical SAM enzyme